MTVMEPSHVLPDDTPFYSIQEAADLLRVHRATIFRLIKAGDIKTHKIGMRTIIKRDDLERLIEAGKQ
jgi:excisionase family DNA binding protein